MVRDLSLIHHMGEGPLPGVERSLPHPIFFRGGATHYSDGEGSLTIHMVRVRKHTRLPLVTYLRGGPPSIWKLYFPKIEGFIAHPSYG